MRILYDPRMSVSGTRSYSPSVDKPRRFMQYLDNQKIAYVKGEVTPITQDDLLLAHAPKYVSGVTSLRESNGLGNRDPRVLTSLYYTSGSLLSAAKAALQEGIACSPTSGFHHAEYHRGGGFCTFNGLVITARKLHDAGLAPKILVLDCDYHYGNGTDDAKKLLQLDWLSHWTAGRYFHNPRQANVFFLELGNVLENILPRMDMLLYQAGADCHVDDPLGGFLTTEQMATRDAMVFSACHKYGVPVAWNFAGGYQPKFENVLSLHLQTYQLAQAQYAPKVQAA